MKTTMEILSAARGWITATFDGTTWEVPDEPGMAQRLAFYTRLYRSTHRYDPFPVGNVPDFVAAYIRIRNVQKPAARGKKGRIY